MSLQAHSQATAPRGDPQFSLGHAEGDNRTSPPLENSWPKMRRGECS